MAEVVVTVENDVEAEKVKRRVDFMRQVGILARPTEIPPFFGCPKTGCTCATLLETLSCQHWKKGPDVV